MTEIFCVVYIYFFTQSYAVKLVRYISCIIRTQSLLYFSFSTHVMRNHWKLRIHGCNNHKRQASHGGSETQILSPMQVSSQV